MEFEPVYIYPPDAEPNASDDIVLAAVFEEEDWEELSLQRDALEFDSLYLGHNEFSNLRAKWRDPLYLRTFYDENIIYFQTPFWQGISRERFVADVAASRPVIFEDFTKSCVGHNVYNHFEPLTGFDAEVRSRNEREGKEHQLVRLKSKYGFIINKITFRIYAIEVDVGCFIITGGAIKIVKEMGQAPNTHLELRKINYLFDLLSAEGINTKEDLFNLLS